MQEAAKTSTLTKYLILEPTDETLRAWQYVGEVEARDRKHAADVFYQDRVEPVTYCAVTETAWQPKKWLPRRVTHATTEDVAMPSSPGRAAGASSDGSSGTW